MDIAGLGTSPNLDSLMCEIDRFGVTQNALELAAYGFTVVPPSKLGVDSAWVERLRNAIIRTCEKRENITIGDYRTASDVPMSLYKGWRLIGEDDAFVEAALNPVGLALIRFLLGQSAVLGSNVYIIKPPTDTPLGLHNDAHGIPLGAGQIAHMLNASWLCTDYLSEEDGQTILVPGSFRFGRAVLPHEQDPDDCPYPVVPLTGEAGSLAIWHGGTFHGSARRTSPGLRITLVQPWFRSYMRPITFWDDVSPELIDRYPELTRILGLDNQLYPYGEEIENPDRINQFMATGADPFA